MAKRRAFMLSASQYMQQVRLPPDFIDKSRTLADELLKDAVYRYHVHRHERQSRVDAKRWKLVKDKHQVVCYRSTEREAPEVMAVGLIPATLEDVLHGAVNFTPEAMHIENALAQGDLLDSRILAILTPPTSADPFDALTVKWVLRNHASLNKQRDYVYLEASGMTTTPDGETVGFLLAHSVKLSAVPEFHKDSHISRGHVSYCYLYRQRKQHGVDVFFKGLLNPLGGVKDRVALGLTVDMAVNACPTTVHLAMMKKLMFCLRTLPTPEPDGRGRGSSRDSRSSHSSGGSSSVNSSMSGRSRSLGSNGSFLRRLTSFSTGSAGISDDFRRSSIFGRAHSQSVDSAEYHASSCESCGRHFNALKTKAKCQLCFKIVCSRCRVVKRVIAFEESVMYPEKLDFCTECVSNTNNTSAAWIAAQELHELEHMLNENQSDNDKKGSDGQRESVQVRKPIWELSMEDRQTMSSEFSTRSSTSSRYMVSLTNSGGATVSAEEVHTVTDLESLGLDDVDEDLTASGRTHKFGEFVLDDDLEDDEDEMPIVESFIDDDHLFDDSDEIFLSVQEEEDEDLEAADYK